MLERHFGVAVGAENESLLDHLPDVDRFTGYNAREEGEAREVHDMLSLAREERRADEVLPRLGISVEIGDGKKVGDDLTAHPLRLVLGSRMC